jgi:hypothetical protein
LAPVVRVNVDLLQMHPMRFEHVYLSEADGIFARKRNPKPALRLRLAELLLAGGFSQDRCRRVTFKKTGRG